MTNTRYFVFIVSVGGATVFAGSHTTMDSAVAQRKQLKTECILIEGKIL